jgi:hypothetical protein
LKQNSQNCSHLFLFLIYTFRSILQAVDTITGIAADDLSFKRTAWTVELQQTPVRCWNCCGGRSQPAGCAGQQLSELQAPLDYLLQV